MAEIRNKAAAAVKNGGAKAKAGAAKVYAMAKDPEVQARVKKLANDGKKIYGAATSPEDKRAYRQAADILKKVRKK